MAKGRSNSFSARVLPIMLVGALFSIESVQGRRVGLGGSSDTSNKADAAEELESDFRSGSIARGRSCEARKGALDRRCVGKPATAKCIRAARAFVRAGCATIDFCNADTLQSALDAGKGTIIITRECDLKLDTQLFVPQDAAIICADLNIKCAFDGQESTRVLEIGKGKTLTLIGLDIKNGYVLDGNGGCIALERGGIGTTLYIRDLSVSGCTAQGQSVDGGGIFVSRVSAGNRVFADNVDFSNNRVLDLTEGKGGAVYCNGGGNSESKDVNEFHMKGGAFTDNHCLGPQEGIQDNCIGGALYSGRNTFVEIEDVPFFGNSANTYGGAINTFPWGTDTSKFDPSIGRPMTLILSNCVFEDNVAAYGASIYASTLPAAPLDRLTFETHNLKFIGDFPPPAGAEICAYNSCYTDGF